MGGSTAASSGATTQDLIGWRMRALGLWQRIPGADAVIVAETASGIDESDSTRAASGADGPARIRAVAEQLLALQGQDWHAVRWALGVRAPGTVDADVRAAFDNGSLVRSWPMRGTIHVLPAEDIGWIQNATKHKVLAGAARRREMLGLDEATLALMTDVTLGRLAGGNALSRDELGAAWTEAGVSRDGERGLGQLRYHVI
ncbi:MAG: winged helix DNA-binding domain-containing protein [Actinobacteria bacterium]|nr:winged helix DNA-binding domain-containing protein [Actinomycetota bacterium]